jgi:hypothetical protein
LTARVHLTLAQTQDARQTQFNRQVVQGVLLDQVGAHAGQVALRQSAELLVEHIGYSQVEHRVAQELQAFIVVRAKAAVRQSLRE